jgi:hypothetical protein
MNNVLFVKKILQKAEHFDWSIQGFGMLRLYLSPEVRLHVWDPERAFPGVSTIHTHPWDFRSDIVSGSISDRTYVIDSELDRDSTTGGPYDTDPVMYSKQRIVCGSGACPVGDAVDVSLRQRRADKAYVAGEGYYHDAREIHESLPGRGCVTLVKRRFKADTEHADVFFSLGTKWKSSEPRKATPAEIRSMCDLALCVMSGQKP